MNDAVKKIQLALIGIISQVNCVSVNRKDRCWPDQSLKRKNWSGLGIKGRMEHIDPLVSRAKALKLELGCKVLLQEWGETIMRMHKGLISRPAVHWAGRLIIISINNF